MDFSNRGAYKQQKSVYQCPIVRVLDVNGARKCGVKRVCDDVYYWASVHKKE